MNSLPIAAVLPGLLAVPATSAGAGRAPVAKAAPNTPVSARRVYDAEQLCNTVSLIDPSTNSLLGLLRLEEPQQANFSRLYRGHLLVDGMGFAPDWRTIAVASIGSDAGDLHRHYEQSRSAHDLYLPVAV